MTSWSTITSTVTVPGKDCTVTSHRVTSKYDTATVSLTETSFVTIDSVVYATKTVIETVSQLCEAATGPTLPISTGDPIPVTSDGPQPIVTGGPDSSAAQSSVTIVEWEADYVTAWTVASLALSTQIPLPIPRTATVDENPNPGRVTLPQCAREGKLTYSFLQGYGWDVSYLCRSNTPKDWLIKSRYFRMSISINHQTRSQTSLSGQFHLRP